MSNFIFLKMNVKNIVFTLAMFFLFAFIEANHSFFNIIALNNDPSSAPSSTPSSILIPIQESDGVYTATFDIGNPPKPFPLYIDTGGTLTWVKCEKPPSTNCNTPSETQYRTHNNFVPSHDPFCGLVAKPKDDECEELSDQCQYIVKYVDKSTSCGVLVRDNIHLKFTDNVEKDTSLVFGCGYEQKEEEEEEEEKEEEEKRFAGILGLSKGRLTILSQLNNLGLIRNVVGHCLRKERGYVFLGDMFNSEPGIVWAPMSQSSLKRYKVGQAEIRFNGDETSVKDLEIFFDSGTAYIYLNHEPYEAVVDLIINDLKETPLEIVPEDELPNKSCWKEGLKNKLPKICWKWGSKSFESLDDVKHYFKPLALRFSENVQLQLSPENYLYLLEKGIVCLGIDEDDKEDNTIGAIALHDKLVIYDNENQQIGWIEECPEERPNVTN